MWQTLRFFGTAVGLGTIMFVGFIAWEVFWDLLKGIYNDCKKK